MNFNEHTYLMSKVINLRKGLDLNLEGTAENIVSNIEGKITDVAICPDDFTGCVPRVVVKEGDNVKIGTPITDYFKNIVDST